MEKVQFGKLVVFCIYFYDLVVHTSVLTLLVLVVENIKLIGSYVNLFLPVLVDINLASLRIFSILLLELQSQREISFQVRG